MGSVLAAAKVRGVFLPYFVGGLEKSLMEQVREMVEPGFTNTELLPWITAAAAVGDCLVISILILVFASCKVPFDYKHLKIV